SRQRGAAAVRRRALHRVRGAQDGAGAVSLAPADHRGEPSVRPAAWHGMGQGGYAGASPARLSPGVFLVSNIADSILRMPPVLALLLVFALPALEASAFVGFIIPGEI